MAHNCPEIDRTCTTLAIVSALDFQLYCIAPYMVMQAALKIGWIRVLCAQSAASVFWTQDFLSNFGMVQTSFFCAEG